MSLQETGNLINIRTLSVNHAPDDPPSGSQTPSTVDTTHTVAIETYVDTLVKTNDADQAEEARQGTYNDGGTGQQGV